MRTRVRARIVGRVQGVGFRPTVYRYATQLGLGGFVRNDPQGVTIEVEGDPRLVGAFFEQLSQQPPQQAVIEGMQTQSLLQQGDRQFAVIESERAGAAAVHISPDLATCPDCLRELFDPRDRRHGYPFLNCTNCGPRFTIIGDLPYDRAWTAMAGFAMCPPCDREYHDPADRRFHAQPDACAVCGPRLRYEERGAKGEERDDGRPAVERSAGSGDPRTTEVERSAGSGDPRTTGEKGEERNDQAAIRAAQDAIRRGGIVAVKSLGGYHLACDATNAAAVACLRERKHRPHKPFAVMFRDLEAVKRFCSVSEVEEAELLSVARPIVILKVGQALEADSRQASCLSIGCGDRQDACRTLSPDSPTIGAFLPYTPLHHLLLQGFEALVMTSGNRTDEPMISDEAELPQLLGPIADAALIHNRPITHKCDDSVVRVVNGQRQFLRRARGFVPNPIRIGSAGREHILAVGGELKNTFCLARDGYAFLSQHIGDLGEYPAYEYFRHEIDEWQRLMRVAPVVIAHDLHPDYRSTRWAKEQGRTNGSVEAWKRGRMEEWKNEPVHTGDCGQPSTLPSFHPSNRPAFQSPVLIGVQHHHAHIASVLGEHGLDGPVIGVAFDGTGYGPDGTVWGGEFLIADRADFERLAHCKQYRLPGGEKAVTEPWRMAESVRAVEAPKWPNSGTIVPRASHLVRQMAVTGLYAPLSSSAGRLFDAVAALLGLGDLASYEAQAAIRLEAAADPSVTGCFEFALQADQEPWVVDFGPAIRALVAARQDGQRVPEIAARFHNTVAAAILAVCRRARDERKLSTVALSGGVFQNELLLRRTVAALQADRFLVFTNTAVPPNDGGLALGQAVVAAARIGKDEERGARSEGRRATGEEQAAGMTMEGEHPCV